MTQFTTRRVPLADAAQRLGVSWPSAWRLALTGEIDAVKNDAGRWYASVESIDRLIASRAAESHSVPAA